MDRTSELPVCGFASLSELLAHFAGAGAERSTTDRPSDALPAVSHGGRAHPTAPAINQSVPEAFCMCGHDAGYHKFADQAGRPCQHPDKNCLCNRYRPTSRSTDVWAPE